MSRTSVLVERTMRKEGYVSAAVVCAQFGITRAQLLDVVLQGKIRPQKPDNSPIFYCNWADTLAYFGTPLEFRSRPKKVTVSQEEASEPEILLDGMIPTPELEDMYRKEAAAKAAAKAASKPQTAAPAQQRVVIRPANFGGEVEGKK